MPSPSRLALAAILLGLILAATTLLGPAVPRFDGHTAAEWLDLLAPVLHTSGKPPLPFRKHELFPRISRRAAEALPALEKELATVASQLQTVRSHQRTRVTLWVRVRALFPGLGNTPPQDNHLETEQRLALRLNTATGLIPELAPDPADALTRLDNVFQQFPGLAVEASAGFRRVTDPDAKLASNLVARIQAPHPNAALTRSAWISALGHLGPQASQHADLLRALTRDPDPQVRFQAIAALGGLDPRDDTAAFIQAAATDTRHRQAAMIALGRMGPRARSAEPFLRDGEKDPDMLTSIFARAALQNLPEADPTILPTPKPSPHNPQPHPPPHP